MAVRAASHDWSSCLETGKAEASDYPPGECDGFKPIPEDNEDEDNARDPGYRCHAFKAGFTVSVSECLQGIPGKMEAGRNDTQLLSPTTA